MKHLIYLVLLFTCSVQAQFEITGRIIDGITKKPLPFATLSTPHSFTIADLDGNFLLTNLYFNDSISVSYVGYEVQKFSANKQKNLVIKLNPIAENLREVSIGKNAATAIMEKVLFFKSKNDPQQKLKFFDFKVYNKLVITANPDSISGTLDSNC
jgi:hypothetical protein